ncbi:NAD(P)-binding protein [Tothia fuscella]|uniref:NAD(P)-binding protein n=1 Tax=Tothia fuscella TaxID=1048955 RepID=A0A9P4P507_9PEZI|nr:NAD(P)-binding protein [Tothia fuscella]
MVPSHLRNVTLLAAAGNLGSKILRNLTSAGFNVTVIQRQGSNKTLPDGVKSIQADLSSKASLVSAFKGQDVVVSAVPDPQLDSQKTLVDAAIEAGVKRIVPSEFSSNLEAKAKELHLPNVSEKLKIREYVEAAGAAGKIEWSSINNGPFLDMGIQYGFLGPNVRSKTATFHDGGEKICCVTSTEDIAKAVALMLQHPEETANKSVYVYSAKISEKTITATVEKLTVIKFEVKHADVQKDAEEYLELLKKGEDDPSKKFSLYFLMMYGNGFGGDYRHRAKNEALGLRVMDDAELESSIARYLKDASQTA